MCPTCEQEVDAEFIQNLLEQELAKIASMNVKKRVNEKLVHRIKTNNALFDKKQKTQKEWEDLYRSIDNSLPSQILDPEELQAKLDEVKAKLQKVRSELSKIAAENEERTSREILV